MGSRCSYVGEPMRKISPILLGTRRDELVGQSLSALCTSSFQDISAVSGLHSFSEAMFLFSLTLLRLISSQHFVCTSFVLNRKRFAFSATSHALYTMTFYIIPQTPLPCQVFFEKNNFLWQKNFYLLTKSDEICYNDERKSPQEGAFPFGKESAWKF